MGAVIGYVIARIQIYLSSPSGSKKKINLVRLENIKFDPFTFITLGIVTLYFTGIVVDFITSYEIPLALHTVVGTIVAYYITQQSRDKKK